ncbi:MAG: hypothetical protein Q8914_12245 [Bacteroidota bacterium]|nr:hypothetical protein [Bacteroidota bacterium]
MTTLYIGAAGTLIFLVLTIVSFVHKRMSATVKYWKYPLFLLPLLVFGGILSTKLYIPFMGVGCSYAENNSLLRPDRSPSHHQAGLLLLFLDGYEDGTVSVRLSDGKTYSAKSQDGVFAMMLPVDSGRIKEILPGEKGDTIAGGMPFTIQPGKLTYIGTFSCPNDFTIRFIPGMAGKSVITTFRVRHSSQLDILRSWSQAGRLVLTPAICNKLDELQTSNKTASRFSGLEVGYLPFTSTSLNGKIQQLSPAEVVKEYETYKFLFKLKQ